MTSLNVHLAVHSWARRRFESSVHLLRQSNRAVLVQIQWHKDFIKGEVSPVYPLRQKVELICQIGDLSTHHPKFMEYTSIWSFQLKQQLGVLEGKNFKPVFFSMSPCKEEERQRSENLSSMIFSADLVFFLAFNIPISSRLLNSCIRYICVGSGYSSNNLRHTKDCTSRLGSEIRVHCANLFDLIS